MKDDVVMSANLKDWPLPDEYLIELGRISSLWLTLESALELTIGKLAGFEIGDYRSFIVLKHSSFPQKLDAFEALCESLQSNYPRLKDYKKVSSQIRSMQTQRNKFVHNIISQDPDSLKFVIAEGSARGKVKTSVSQIQHKDLKKLSMEMHIVSLALHELITGMSYPPKWAKTE